MAPGAWLSPPVVQQTVAKGNGALSSGPQSDKSDKSKAGVQSPSKKAKRRHRHRKSRSAAELDSVAQGLAGGTLDVELAARPSPQLAPTAAPPVLPPSPKPPLHVAEVITSPSQVGGVSLLRLRQTSNADRLLEDLHLPADETEGPQGASSGGDVLRRSSARPPTPGAGGSARLSVPEGLCPGNLSRAGSLRKLELPPLSPARTGSSTKELSPLRMGPKSPVSSPRKGGGTPRAIGETERMMETLSPVRIPPPDLSWRRYLAGEVTGSSTLGYTPSVGMDMKRHNIYNTMFHVPWRVELVISVGFLVCLDAFLAIFTIMPIRVACFVWRTVSSLKHIGRPRADELCDVACLLILLVGVVVLHLADISFIYHWIRGQAIIKLYVVFNVLEIIDKLLQSFGADVMQVLLNSAGRVGLCPTERLAQEFMRLLLDQSIATVTYVLHSLVILSQAITLNVAINSHNNALLTLLISNNFVEIKGNVFKRLGRENLHKLAYLDTVERVHIMSHLLFVIVQNLINSEEPWLRDLASNAAMIVVCEMLVDAIKHAFLARFNEMKPAVYGDFLRALCHQIVQSGSHEVHKTLSFVPLAPACVVMRVLSPLLVSTLPVGSLVWRWAAGLLICLGTMSVLVVVKVILGLGLQAYASWYLNRCLDRDKHFHQD